MEANLLPLAVGSGIALFFIAAVLFITRFLYVCRPNEILIFSGRTRVAEDGRRVGYRVVSSGRSFRMPIIETVERMDMRLLSVPMTVQGAYSEGGIPLSMHAIANVKISSNPLFRGNAIERFLGRDREEIARVAKETLEGHLRGVLATMTPEEVNEDRLKFAAQLTEEAGDDLAKLGLQLDTLKIQHVSDDRNYLDSIGRKRIAEILRTAEVAESDAVRSAEESEAAAKARAEVAMTKAQAAIEQKRNELRQVKAELEASARSEEERAEAKAQAARAEAEKKLQTIRAELERLRLEADVTIPAEAERQVHELEAAGHAAAIEENGRAMALALGSVAQAWAETEGKAMDIYVLQHLDDIFGEVTQAAGNMKAREVSLIDSGDGSTMPSYMSAYPAAVGALLDQVSNTLGVDVAGVLKGTGDGSAPAPAPAPRVSAVEPSA